MADALALLWLPFAAAALFVLIHAYLGLHVLRRGIVFADLALAQLSALGASIAFAAGHAPTSAAGLADALVFTVAGALLLTASRGFAAAVSQEAFIGVLYVVATAATILVVDRSPQGAEHVKRILVGSILAVTPAELVRLAVLYGAVGLVHVLARRPILALSEGRGGAPGSWRGALWDFLFYVSFGVVVTSSVATAGVLLVFCFLIVPALIGTLFARAIGAALAIGWCAGVAASAGGLAAAFVLDLPTGAALVLAFAVALLLAGLVRGLLAVPCRRRRARFLSAGRALVAVALLLLVTASLWLIAAPAADQPVLALAERVLGLGPEPFLSAAERDAYGDALATARRWETEAERLTARERRARWQGEGLGDEEVRRIGSYQQSFNEMSRGERFVVDTLRTKARERERWWVGLPVAFASTLGLALLFWPRPPRRI